MIPDNRPGRHRAPGGYSPLGELKSLARDSAQPAMKGAAVVAAAGGLVATIAGPVDASPASARNVAAAPAAPSTAAAVVGPAAAAATSLATTDRALSTFGFAAAPTTGTQTSTTKPVVIKDVIVEQARKAAADRAAAQQRASRTLSRQTLTATTYTRKSTTNTTSGTAGQRSSYNWATAGQCTWGALNKWYQSEGYYPGGWTGNALTWGYGAANAGYTVSSIPRTRSIVVMQPGVYGASSAGHVAWVTAVNGNQVTFIEMNATAGPYNYDTRTVTNISGMQYIYAP